MIARAHPSLRGGPGLVHADAYRLGSRIEVDDLDLDADLDHSVTVVEWGEGLVENLAAAHLLVVIDRPATLAGGGRHWSHGGEDGGDQPRTVNVTGYGDRWAQRRLVGGCCPPDSVAAEVTDPDAAWASPYPGVTVPVCCLRRWPSGYTAEVQTHPVLPFPHGLMPQEACRD